MSGTKHKHTILYAEDDQDDLFMVREAFHQYDETTDLIHAANGFEALVALRRMHNNHTLPCLIILDINMPGMDGKEALIRIRQTEEFSHMPVVLFTTSSSDNDRSFAKRWKAEFITKPLVFAELEELAKTFLELCSTTVSAKA